MMRLRIVCAAVITVLLAGMPTAAALDAPVQSLLEHGNVFDGQEVTVTGELVGDYGFRADGSMWTQINDDTYVERPIAEHGGLHGGNIGVGVRIPGDLAEGLSDPGGYRRRGPVVALTGVWRWHDPDMAGESYLAVASLEVVDDARALTEHPDPVSYGLGVVLLVLAFGIWRSYVRRRDTR